MQKNENGVQHTLAVDVPSHWEVVALEKVLDDIVGGGTPSKANPSYWEGSIPWLTIKDMRTHRPEDAVDHITAAAVRESSTNVIPADTVIIATRIGLGKVIRVPYDAAINQDLKALINKPEIDKGYLEYWIISIADYLESIGSGTTVKGIRLEQLRSLPFPLAPLEQQKRIVAEIEKQFSRLDEAVANLKRVKANLKRYKAAVLKAAVEGKLTEEWRKQHPYVESASKLLERILTEHRKKWEEAELAKMKAKGKEPKNDKWKKKYKEPGVADVTDLPELPKEWVWVTWEFILAHEDGAFKRGPFGSALKKSIFVKAGYKLYEQYCPINDDCSFARYFITEEKFKEMEGFSVTARDFLISCSGVTLGRITQVPYEYEEGVINQALLRVRVNGGAMDDSYFIRFFRSPYFQKQIFKNSQGAAIPNVKGVKELKAIPIPLPPLEEQIAVAQLIDEKMSVVSEIEKQLDTNLKRAERLHQSILSKAFSGQLIN